MTTIYNSAGLLRCPVCAQQLEKDGQSLRCGSGHCYDIARAGYVNLLMSNQSSGRRHGDDRTMLDARAEFLDKGFYSPVSDSLCGLAAAHAAPAAQSFGGVALLDCGCGDGWYTMRLLRSLVEHGTASRALGIDISREALRLAARRNREPGCGFDLSLAVASAYSLPAADGVFDMITCVFAPMAAAEFARVLRDGGVLLTAVPLERHLFGLKSAVYDKPYENPHDDGRLDGFELAERRRAEYTLELDGADARRLFMMTPYYYKTSRADQEKLEHIEHLSTEVAIEVRAYRKAAR